MEPQSPTEKRDPPFTPGSFFLLILRSLIGAIALTAVAYGITRLVLGRIGAS